MHARARLTTDRFASSLLVIGIAGLALVSPVHNDTWWHLRYGREMVLHGGFAQVDSFSFTAAGHPFPNHEWLAERVLYAAYALGGLQATTLLCAVLLTTGWWLVWRLMCGDLADRAIVLVVALSASTSIWSIRPQAFTIALLPVTLTLLANVRLWPLPFIVALWANLHGGVLVGLVAIAAATVSRWLDAPRTVPWRHVGILAASALATLLTPLGARYFPEIVGSLVRSRVNGIIEWRPPTLQPEYLPFWLTLLALGWVSARRWRESRGVNRMLVVASACLGASALGAVRNIPSFMMAAAPALTRLLSSRPSNRAEVEPRYVPAGVGVASLLAAGATVVTFVAVAWWQPWPPLGWRPMSASAAAAIAGCPAPIYNRYGDGGAIIWFVPQQPVFLDSRQDPFPTDVVQAATHVEATGDYGNLFARFAFNCAVVRPGSPVARALHADGWSPVFSDVQWLVLERPHR